MHSATITELLSLRSATMPDIVAYSYLGNGEEETERITYRELEQRALAIASGLREHAAASDRAVLIYPPGLEFLIAFMGCLYARIIAVPLHAPRPTRHNDRLASIVANADPALVLTTRDLLPKVRQSLREDESSMRLRILTTEDCDVSSTSTDIGEQIKSDDIAFLQYTSGSTSTPKGVMISHSNLISNQQMIQSAFGGTQDSIILGWLPLYHDMGLIGNILQTLWVGARCILMSPAAFLQRPMRWLEAISKHQVTISGGPDFAYRLCAEKFTDKTPSNLDLSSWIVAFNGSEPIRTSTMDQFAKRFEPYGFRRNAFVPCYGLAEATLFVSGKPEGRSPAVYRCNLDKLRSNVVEQDQNTDSGYLLASSGVIADHLKVEIVDPNTSAPAVYGHIGEIWVGGPSVAQGYWRNEPATQDAFSARTVTSNDPFLRTGDLGFRIGDELFVTGRLKDLIIVRGQNYYPQDIEATAAKSDPLLSTSIGAAFSLENDSGSSVVLVQEVPRGVLGSEDLTRLERSIRQGVAERDGVSLDAVMLVKFGTVPRTTSGKVQRQACRELYRNGNFEDVRRPNSQSPGNSDSSGSFGQVRLKSRLTEISLLAAEAAQLDISQIDSGSSLHTLGLDSLMMTNLRFQFEERLGLSVSLESMLSGKSLLTLSEEARSIPSVRIDHHNVPAPTPDETDSFPLSVGQKAIWFLHLLDPESPAYNLFSASRSALPFDIPVLRKAFQTLSDRYSLLRSIVVNSPQGPLHQPLQDFEVDFSLIDGTDWNDETLNQYLIREANRPFDPAVTPPFRIHVVRQADRGDVLLISLHHLLADLGSISILLDDLRSTYSALLNQAEVVLPERPHYRSFVASQAEALTSGRWSVQRDFWMEYLRDAELALAPPFDRSSQSPRGRGGTFRFRIGEELAKRVKLRASSCNVSLYTYLLAAFEILLLRITAQDDLLVGSLVSGRTSPMWAATVGYCVNQIVLRARWNGDNTFEEFLSHSQEDVSKTLQYQDYPFSTLTEEFHSLYGSRGVQLTRVMFSLQTAARRTDLGLSSFLLGHDGNRLRLGEFELDALEIDNEDAQFDLSLVISEGASELLGVLQYRSDLLEREFIETLARQFQLVLETVTSNPNCLLKEVPLLSEQERIQIVEHWNRTEVPYERDISIDEFVERYVEIAPDACAVRAQDGDLTYGELSQQSNQLEKLLRLKGVNEETVVGLHCHRTKHLPIAMLAILKAGGAFLPLDPALPKERAVYMLELTAAPILLTDETEAWSDLARDTPIEIIKVDDPSSWSINGHFHVDAKQSRRSPTDRLAYVIFTSGSTGQPKGVMVTHRNVINFFKGMDSHLDCRPGDKFIALTSISFDISILELLWPLTHGAEIALVPERGRRGTSLLSIAHQDSRGPEFSLFYFADASEQRGPERYRLLLEGAKFADRNGFAAVWTPERHFHRFGGSYPSPSVTSAAVAAITERIAIRAGSVVLPLHDPIRVAEEWSTIDNLSGGRVGVAFASGWHVDDFVLAPDRYANRREVMLAGITRLQRLWRGEPVEGVNGNGKPIEIHLYPSPVQSELPIWITASGTPATFELAGTLGANLLTHLLGQTLDEVAANIERYHEALKQNGFDPATRCVTLMLHTYLGEDRDAVKDRIRAPFREYLRSSLGLVEKLIASLGLPVDLKSLSPKDLDDLLDFAFNRYWESSGLFGTVDGCKPMVDRIAKMGVNEIACLLDFGVDTDLVLDSLPLLQRLMQTTRADTTPHDLRLPQSDRKPKTFLQCTPSMMKLLLAEGDDLLLSTIDTLLLGGEPLPVGLFDRIAERYPCRVFNMYGPTETTIWSTVQEMRSGEYPVTVGKPIANTQCYILDRHDLPVPPGAIGELMIGGDGVARGYWGRVDLTNDRFIPNRFNSREGSRLYRTGDLARYLQDGRIEVLGRSDHQVKIRGFRVELSEIEIALAAHAEIRDVVVVKRSAGDDVRLAAFYVSSTNVAIAADALRELLRRTLPEYMIPSEFVHVEKIPLMTSGKVDRKQLEALQVKPSLITANGHHSPVLPHGNLESHVLEIWKKVLAIDVLGLDDNFFDLGGHSLLMVQVHTALVERLGHPFPLIKLLENPTIRQLAAALSTDESKPSERSLPPEANRASLQRNRLNELRRNAVTMRTVAS